MPRIYLRWITYLLPAAILCFFCWPATAAADSTDVVTLAFSGSGICIIGSCGSGTTVVGTYSFDPDTGSIVGPWSFSTPFGTFSSSDIGASSSVAESESFPPALGGISWPAGIDDLFFTNSAGGVGLGFADPQDYYGPITTYIQKDNIKFGFSDVFENDGSGTSNTPNVFALTSGTAASVPEPSSLPLLATGLVALPLLRRRSTRRHFACLH